MEERPFQFEWDPAKAEANERKHGTSFGLASTVFNDANLLTVADLEHSEQEPRWFSIGIANNGAPLAVAYLWSDADPAAIKIRILSARSATRTEIRQYEERK
ncbi:MAG TPA: BrnT family toxin [Terriglobia bacterium]